MRRRRLLGAETHSFQGTVWKTGPTGGVPTPWVKTDLLIPHGFTTVGANGLAFDHAETPLFVGNRADHSIIRVPVVNGEAGQPELWVVIGPDGMFVDEEDRLWVVALSKDRLPLAKEQNLPAPVKHGALVRGCGSRAMLSALTVSVSTYFAVSCP